MHIKKPGAVRRTFALVNDQGKTVKDPRIDAINGDLKRGRDLAELTARMHLVLASYRPEKRVHTALPVNLRLVEERHEAKTLENVDLVDPAYLKHRLVRAVEAIGPVSLQEAGKEEILRAIAHIKDRSVRFEIIRGINELLKHANRALRLKNPRPPRPDEISFIRISQFKERTQWLKPEYEVYLGALFATGCRFGELPAATLFKDRVEIKSQIRDNGERGQTKNKRPRTSPVLPPLQEYVERYNAQKEEMLHLRLHNHKRLYYACIRAYGVNIHALRHSYAVEWGAVGASTAEIARYIGDTAKVCEDHYRNYCATQDEIDLARRRFRLTDAQQHKDPQKE